MINTLKVLRSVPCTLSSINADYVCSSFADLGLFI